MVDDRLSGRGLVTLTGGEPFLHPDFRRLAEKVVGSAQLDLAILTNGSCVDARTARWLSDLRPAYVQVSLEGPQRLNDRIRAPGAFGTAVRAMRHLVEAGVRTCVSFTASRANYLSFPQVARITRRLGVARVWSDRLVPVGGAHDLRSLTLTPRSTRKLLRLMHAERARSARSGTEVAMFRALQFLEVGGAPYRCSAGDTLLALLPNGDLLPCRRMPIVVGNVYRSSMLGLYERAPLLRRLRNTIVARGCEQCSYASRCRGGLRCLSNAVHGDPFIADPGCWIAARNVRRVEREQSVSGSGRR